MARGDERLSVRWPITASQKARVRLGREIKRVARDDLDAVAADVAALEARAESCGGESLDAYYRAVSLHAGASERLVVAQTLSDVRAVARDAARARHAIAVAAALLDGGTPPDEHAAPCFFDPAHGISLRPVVFAPDGGAMRQLPACGACAEEVDAGRVPAIRKVLVDGQPESYWRSPAHAGYFAPRGGGGVTDLLDLFAFGSSGGAGELIGFGLLDLLLDAIDSTRS